MQRRQSPQPQAQGQLHTPPSRWRLPVKFALHDLQESEEQFSHAKYSNVVLDPQDRYMYDVIYHKTFSVDFIFTIRRSLSYPGLPQLSPYLENDPHSLETPADIYAMNHSPPTNEKVPLFHYQLLSMCVLI